VEIVPGANLGKMLVRVPRRKELFPALDFALRSDAQRASLIKFF
jgi:hypothetical protein